MCPSNAVCGKFAVDPNWSVVQVELFQNEAGHVLLYE